MWLWLAHVSHMWRRDGATSLSFRCHKAALPVSHVSRAVTVASACPLLSFGSSLAIDWRGEVALHEV